MLHFSEKGKRPLKAKQSASTTWISSKGTKSSLELIEPITGREVHTLFVLEDNGLRRIQVIDEAFVEGPLFSLPKNLISNARKVLIGSTGLYVVTPSEILYLEST